MSSLNDVANNVSELGGKAHVFHMDIESADSVEKLFIKSKEIGFVDIVINNAGFGKFDSIQNINIKDWDSQLSVNLRYKNFPQLTHK